MKNKKIIQDVLEDCNISEVIPSDTLDDLDFDSLSSINLMSIMSNDYDIAIHCGATHIRIGTSIFGERS